ncbi:hypothetical protein KAR91_55970 [Candidatus Pacearchaeota archaeon]|nr:hypothetical protein [Candidatus Pacearchaeota archaeon]
MTLFPKKWSEHDAALEMQESDYLAGLVGGKNVRISPSVLRGVLNFGLTLGNTGVISGCKVSKNAEDSALIDMEPGEYEIKGAHYFYLGAVAQNPGFSTAPAEDTSFMYLDEGGLQFRNTSGDLKEWTNTELETRATLTRLTSVSSVDHTIYAIRDDRWFTGGRQQIQRTFQNEAIGNVYARGSGGTISKSATEFQLNQDVGGVIFDTEQTRHELGEFNDIGGIRIISSGPSFLIQSSLVIPTSYDDGAGGLTALSPNKWASHTLLKSPKGNADDGNEGTFFIIISSTEYATIELAQAAPIDFGLFKNAQIISVARIIVEGNGITIEEIIDQRPFLVSYGAR